MSTPGGRYLVVREEPAVRGEPGELDDGAQKESQPAEQQAQVVTGGGQEGVHAIAREAGEVVAVHSMVALHMADHRFDRRAASHLPADGTADPARLAGNPDLEAVGTVVAAIASVHVNALDGDAAVGLDVGDRCGERVAVEGIAVQRLGRAARTGRPSACSPG